MPGLVPAALPTMHFIGVSTAQSSIMTVFPRWADALGLGTCAINGIDLPLHAPAAAYREAVSFIRDDPRSMGALVTAHKIDLLHAAGALIDALDPHAAALREVSCLSKRGGTLIGHAKDPVSARLALDAIVPEGHWRRSAASGAGGDAFLMGAGGAATAITWNLMHPARATDSPRRIVVSDVDAARLEGLRRFHRSLGSAVPVEYVLAASAEQNDAVLHALAARSLVVNATGLGKDRPGSPLGANARFPDRAIVWELNYRGDLLFLDRAEGQARANLTTSDGWTYFLHGWTQAISEVFAVQIPSSGPAFEELSALAGGPPRARKRPAA